MKSPFPRHSQPSPRPTHAFSFSVVRLDQGERLDPTRHCGWHLQAAPFSFGIALWTVTVANFLTLLCDRGVLFSNLRFPLWFAERPLVGVWTAVQQRRRPPVLYAQATRVPSDLDWTQLTDLEVKGSVPHY